MQPAQFDDGYCALFIERHIPSGVQLAGADVSKIRKTLDLVKATESYVMGLQSGRLTTLTSK